MSDEESFARAKEFYDVLVKFDTSKPNVLDSAYRRWEELCKDNKNGLLDFLIWGIIKYLEKRDKK